MTDTNLPRELPGRESDDALHAPLAALDDVRASISARVEETQGAWRRLPLWQRAAPVALAALTACAWIGHCVSRPTFAITASALTAFVAATVAIVAVGLAPRTPGRAERVALAAVVLGVAAWAVEALVGVRALAAPVPGDDVVCARAILLGCLLPIALAALHVRRARTPARPRHLAAIAGGGLLASMGAVWAECPATELAHVGASHIAAPLVVVAVLAVAARSLLRG